MNQLTVRVSIQLEKLAIAIHQDTCYAKLNVANSIITKLIMCLIRF